METTKTVITGKPLMDLDSILGVMSELEGLEEH